MTMASLPLDNPSYFSVSENILPPHQRGKFKLFLKKMGSSSSQDSGLQTVAAPLLKSPPGANGNTRRQFRTLLRSVSSNSTDSNKELLVLGEPRPSDIAPPSPCLAARRHTDPRRKRTEENHHLQEKMYSPLATSEEHAVLDADNCLSDGESEEVFITEDSARYYNISSTRETGRRHSVGTYLATERERALSIASSTKSCKENLQNVAVANEGQLKASVSATDGKQFKKRSNRLKSKDGAASAFNMDDIAFISNKSSETVCQWVKYLQKTFETIGRPTDRIIDVGLEEFSTGSLNLTMCKRISQVKLQVVIICPQFLELVSNPATAKTLCNVLRPDCTIAILLCVADDDIIATKSPVFETYNQWQRFTVSQDEDQKFARDFIYAAVNILTKVAKQQQAQVMKNRTMFSLAPKKVTLSQKCVVIFLTEPLNNDDQVKVSINQNGELLEIKSFKKRNPYSLKFTMPDACFEVSSIVNVLVEKNGDMLGATPVKCENRLRELDQILRNMDNPLEFMCQTLDLNPFNKTQLDEWMLRSLQKNIPPHFNLITNPSDLGDRTPNHSNQEEYPTLLHFAAKFGLEKLSWQLLECPGGSRACEIRNSNGCTPADMAETAGHKELASAMQGYMKMEQFSNIYSKFYKEMAQDPKNAEIDDEEYMIPLALEMTYSIPPPARPVSPCISNTNPETGGYMEMQRSGRATPITKRTTKQSSSSFCTEEPSDIRSHSSDVCDRDSSESHNFNYTFSIKEAEKLYEIWTNTKTGSKSTQEFRNSLKEMNEMREGIQSKLTLFGRLKGLFQRNRTKENGLTISKYNDADNSCRPISSLSLQSTTSSTSSGRMSTISAISTGDSGTHSDPDDRKTTGPIIDHEYYTINEQDCNYLIPPAPKPVINKYNTGKINYMSPIAPICERNPEPLPRVENDTFYHQFTPSSRPVEGLQKKSISQPEYLMMDSGKQNNNQSQVEEVEDAPEYMNLIVPRN